MTPYQFHLMVAVLVSLWLHLAFIGAYHASHSLRNILRTVGLAKRPAATALARPTPTLTFVPVIQPDSEPAAPQVFIETDKSQVTGDEPGPTPFYSDQATVAANPENPTDIEGDTPYVKGEETRILSTADVPMPTPGALALSRQRLQDARQAAEPAPEPEAAAPFGLTQPAADPQRPQLAMAGDPAGPDRANSEPRTALAFPGRDIAAKKSRLVAGGVNRTGVTAFNVASNPFGAYDRELIRAVQQSWYVLIDRFGVFERAGSVTLHFELYDDGTIRNLQRRENTAGEILALYCEKAVTDAAPFAPLTEELRRLVGSQARQVDFTFYY